MIDHAISIHALREEGDTPPEFVLLVFIVFLSTPSARRATELHRVCAAQASDFYPRPPRGGRRSRPTQAHGSGRFLSTPSARRATQRRQLRKAHLLISIHALREEGDGALTRPLDFLRISIHALREEGDTDRQIHKVISKISIHALREEGDLQCLVTWSSHRYFYPRPPRGGRQGICK